MTMSAAALTIRPYRDADVAPLVELLEASMGGGPTGSRTADFFSWKHLANPFGRSLILVAEDAGRPVGLRAFMRWNFGSGERTYRAARAVDTATHPDYRRMGIFSQLTRGGIEALREEGTHFIFNTPNEKSLPGYLKMGWATVGTVPVWLRVRRPVRFAADLIAERAAGRITPRTHAGRAPEVLATYRPALASLLDTVATGDYLSTPRTAEYLEWRYCRAVGLDYRAVALEEQGRLAGLAFFRVRPRGNLWEATVSELLVARGRPATAQRLLREVVGSSGVDHLTCHFSPAVAGGTGPARAWLNARRGMTFVANSLSTEVQPDPAQLGSWALSLGDLEVF